MENNSRAQGGGYRTRQRELILERLIEASERHITADELAEMLRGEKVGRSTVYRTLERLVESGEVRRYYMPDGGACYQYAAGENCHEHHHLKCVRCGRLLHAECGFLDELAEHIMQHHRFTLDRSRTVLYGVCEQCSAEESAE